MIINGREIAELIYAELKKRVVRLQQKGILPHLVVLLIGENPASLAYIAQKKLHAERIEAKVTIMKFPETITTEEIVYTIEKLNNDPLVHAILIQKPLPTQINIPNVDEAVIPEKDVDGFNHKSTFVLALPLAVMTILEHIYSLQQIHSDFISWLKTKNIVILGKGPTAGGPTIIHLEKLGLNPHVIDSKTPNAQERMQKADILISAVGKDKAVTAQDVKKGVILIGVGVHRGLDGKNHGDYIEEDIKDIASYYTPTPRGVGPVNVACLMKNVISAAELQTQLFV